MNNIYELKENKNENELEWITKNTHHLSEDNIPILKQFLLNENFKKGLLHLMNKKFILKSQ